MPVRPLPSNPNLDHLRHQAKDLLKGQAAHDPGVAQRIREFHPRFSRATDAEIFEAQLKLSDVQLAIAREHGFPSWPRLKRHIEKPTLADQLNLPHHQRIDDAGFRHAVDLLDVGNVAGLRAYLRQHPELARQRVLFEGGNYFRNPTLLEFIAENPTRHGRLPANIVDVARVILDAGATKSALDETLMLAASSQVAHECGVQLALLDLLCDYGADPDTATRTAAMYGEFEAVKALIRRGASLDLSLAAALGRIDDARRLLPAAEEGDRRWALALASQFGYVGIVSLLLDSGEDPNRYNPVGGHSHSTPLHQTAAGGHLELARLLVERGARLDWKDTLWQATPAEWARHEGRTEVEAYLRDQEAVKEKRA
ncbi:MAG TPA: ankyrin repeat domain-containing protein [Candidatus Binatia bacterium]|nr:ankyrin repeat domain-containing protein [Candidatus Binatia bacterium]